MLQIGGAFAVLVIALFASTSQMERNAIFGYNQPTEYRLRQASANVIPLNHPWNDVVRTHNAGWPAFDHFYRNQILAESSAPYHDHLRFKAISHLVAETYFLLNAPAETRWFYLRELESLPYIPDPNVALSLVQSLWENNGPVDVDLYNFTQGIEHDNRTYLGEDGFAAHNAMYRDTYDELRRLGDL
ncbi:hypothetical protein A3850_010475 [Lewinella sp. 4G2]|nr:hypothetical protein A3850_010475 [Lewinella sp. 4G2]